MNSNFGIENRLFSRSLILTVAFVGASLVCSCDAHGQVQLRSGVISSGGGFASGAGIELHSTIGEPAAGVSGGLSSGFWAAVGEVTSVAVDDVVETPDQFRLHQNYPNPFNPSATIRYDVASAGHVRLAVFDVLGRQVRLLVDAVRPAGRHAVDIDARDLPSGTYVYVIEVNDFTAARTMLLIK